MLQVLNPPRKNNILQFDVPRNMTKLYQPIDVTANGFATRFIGRKLNNCHTDQVSTVIGYR